jgi:hypothetical protein
MRHQPVGVVPHDGGTVLRALGCSRADVCVPWRRRRPGSLHPVRSWLQLLHDRVRPAPRTDFPDQTQFRARVSGRTPEQLNGTFCGSEPYGIGPPDGAPHRVRRSWRPVRGSWRPVRAPWPQVRGRVAGFRVPPVEDHPWHPARDLAPPEQSQFSPTGRAAGPGQSGASLQESCGSIRSAGEASRRRVRGSWRQVRERWPRARVGEAPGPNVQRPFRFVRSLELPRTGAWHGGVVPERPDPRSAR